MMPSIFVTVERMPLTASGKIDRKTLAKFIPQAAQGGLRITWQMLKEVDISTAADTDKRSASNEGVEGQEPQEPKESAVLSAEEKERLLVTFNDTAVDYPGEKTISRLIEEQAVRTPRSIALVGRVTAQPQTAEGGDSISTESQEVHLSYAQLNRSADTLAARLVEKGVKPGEIVGLAVDRTIQIGIGILAILKTGAAYLPIGTEFPDSRVAFLLEDSQTSVILTEGRELPGNNFHLIDVSIAADADIGADTNADGRSQDLTGVNNPEAPAYLIYTSGTTGTPKGVKIPHRSAINFFKGITDLIDFRPGDRVLSLVTVSFDIFAMETLLPLTVGCAVVLGTVEEQSLPQETALALEKQNITMLQATPSMLQFLGSHDEAFASLRGLRYLMVGGESFRSPY